MDQPLDIAYLHVLLGFVDERRVYLAMQPLTRKPELSVSIVRLIPVNSGVARIFSGVVVRRGSWERTRNARFARARSAYSKFRLARCGKSDASPAYP
jgi:hypothetical protein